MISFNHDMYFSWLLRTYGCPCFVYKLCSRSSMTVIFTYYFPELRYEIEKGLRVVYKLYALFRIASLSDSN